MKETDYQHHFQINTQRANPQPGTEIWLKAGRERHTYPKDKTQSSLTIYSGAPFLPEFADKEIGSLFGLSLQNRPPMLIEVDLLEPYRNYPPSTDELLRLVFKEWEQFILRCHRGAERILTPSQGPAGYHPLQWLEFLEFMGYREVNPALWARQLRKSQPREYLP